MIRGMWKAALAIAIAAACMASEAKAAFSLQITGPGGYNQTVNSGTDNISLNALPGGGVPGIGIVGNVNANYFVFLTTGQITQAFTLTNSTAAAITLTFTATQSALSSSSPTPTVTTGLQLQYTTQGSTGSDSSSTLINGSTVPGSSIAFATEGSGSTSPVAFAVASPFSFANTVTVTVGASSVVQVQSNSSFQPQTSTITPEPSTLIALATALPLLGFKLRRRQKALAAA